MSKLVSLACVLGALWIGLGATPALADFSACSSADIAKDPQQQIDLYTICLKHGGLMAPDVSGALNNRGVAYYQLGMMDKAFDDFSWAIKYDPTWPTAYINRVDVELGRGQCAQALADMDSVLKFDRRKQYVEKRAHIAATCPIQSKPPQ